MRFPAKTISVLLLAGASLLALRSYKTRENTSLPSAQASFTSSPSADSTAARAPADLTSATDQDFTHADAPPTPLGPNVLGEWTGHPPILPWQVAREQARENSSPATRIPLRLSAERTGIMSVDGYQPTEEDGGVFQGTLEGHPGSTVILSFIGRAQAGVVLLPDEHRAYNFRAGDDGILRVTELDTRNAPDCGLPTVPQTPPRT